MGARAEAPKKAEEQAWRWFADAHPHEAAAMDWPRFVAHLRLRTGEGVP